jgi:hypothetical protein
MMAVIDDASSGLRGRGLGEHHVARQEADDASEAGPRRKVQVPREELFGTLGTLGTWQLPRRDGGQVIAWSGEDVAPSCHDRSA